MVHKKKKNDSILLGGVRKKQSQHVIPLTVTVGGIMIATKNVIFHDAYFGEIS